MGKNENFDEIDYMKEHNEYLEMLTNYEGEEEDVEYNAYDYYFGFTDGVTEDGKIIGFGNTNIVCDKCGNKKIQIMHFSMPCEGLYNGKNVGEPVCNHCEGGKTD